MHQRRTNKYGLSSKKNDAYEPRRCRINASGNQKHKEHVADRGYNSMSLCNLVHLPIPIPEAMNIREPKVAVDKE